MILMVCNNNNNQYVTPTSSELYEILLLLVKCNRYFIILLLNNIFQEISFIFALSKIYFRTCKGNLIRLLKLLQMQPAKVLTRNCQRSSSYFSTL